MKTNTVIKVRGYHTDLFGHVNHARYIEFLEEGRWGYMEENRLLDLFHSSGLIHVVTRVTVDYRHSAGAGDIIGIETGLIQADRSSFTMGQHVSLDAAGTLVVEAEVTNVFVDAGRHQVTVPDCRFIDGWRDLDAILKKGKSDG